VEAPSNGGSQIKQKNVMNYYDVLFRHFSDSNYETKIAAGDKKLQIPGISWMLIKICKNQKCQV